MTHYFAVVSPEHPVTLSGLPDLPCPWCYREQDIAFPRHLSSTICQKHGSMLEAQIEAIRARKRAESGKDSPRDEEEHAE